MPEARKLAEKREKTGFTVYLEGHEGHQGNVLVHAFLGKVHRLVLVLNKLERAFIESSTRQTDFEIVDADKRNPTTLSLKPVPRVLSYNPIPALRWSIEQIEAVGQGQEPDARVGAEIASDLVKLAMRESEYGYKAFWINGHAQAVRFDEEYLANAQRVARERVRKEAPNNWHVGASLGSIVGELKKVDDFDADNEFVVVPPTGPEFVKCVFPESMRAEMGKYLFKMVRVSGALHYGEDSPFPHRVVANEGGIQLYPPTPRRRTFAEMRGMFADREPGTAAWSTLLNGR